MSFDHLEYWILLVVAFASWYAFPIKLRWAPLLAISYVFYGFWRPEFCLLLAASTLVDYISAQKIEAAKERKTRLSWLWLSIGVNLSLLIFFKISVVLSGVGAASLEQNILLPIGISFYTFQTMGYTIDVYKKRIAAERHLGYFALYIAFFPQLIAGPIERASALLPQLRSKVRFSWLNLSVGGRLIVLGLFKKLVVGDHLYTLFAMPVFEPQGYSTPTILLSTLIMTLWIYVEFSAYTDMAIGSAKLLGIDLMSNFKRPFFSRNMSTLWSRWHISLTSWIQQFFFKPLVRTGALGSWSSGYILIVYLVIGAWHGLSPNFLLFGLYMGLIILIERRWTIPKSADNTMLRFLLKSKTVLLWGISGFFFFSDSLDDLMHKLSMNSAGSMGIWEQPHAMLTNLQIALVGMCFLFALDVINNKDLKNPVDNIPSRGLRWLIYYGMIFAIITLSNYGQVGFAYYQF